MAIKGKTVKVMHEGKVYDHSKLPRGMRGLDPEGHATSFKEGPLARLWNRTPKK